MTSDQRIAGIELGGTKVICGIATAAGEVLQRTRIPTRGPEETLLDIRNWLQPRLDVASGLGIASFGPIHVDPASPRYGHIGATPKTAWRDFDLLRAIREWTTLPSALDTDVNAAALAEIRWGAAHGHDNVVYVTVGTGIGGGIVANGRAVHGLMHPEIGHMKPRRLPDDDFDGMCPFHGDCFEGLAAGPAIRARWGKPLNELPADHPAFAMEADYLGQLAVNLLLTASPTKLIFGGGVMNTTELLPMIRNAAARHLNDYLDLTDPAGEPRELIVTPGLESNAGLLGAVALAIDAS
ncbi:MAG: ROK family protein [Gammaproteobacteria bacterium]|nr:ROK family protein [Gammaproteobacteria bacterium]MBT8109327.1 ROK family protein [Gammaproteobacteria bacterium]NNL44029.1 ROK family protein [Woeseiaceae bacterium]